MVEGLGPEALDQPGGQGQGLDVEGDPPLDARAQHLHRHLGPIQQAGAVGLGQGGGRHRLVEAAVEALQRPAEGLCHRGLGLGGGERIEPVLQPAEVLGEVIAEDVGAGGEHLAELDGDGAQPLQGAGQPLPRAAAAGAAAGDQPQDPAEQLGPRRQQGLGLAGDQGVGAGQGPDRAGQAGGRAELAHGQSAQPWCSATTPPVKLVQPVRPNPAWFISPFSVGWSGKRRMLSTRYW